MSRSYPDAHADSEGFERPPIEFTDAHGREIEIEVYTEAARDPLEEMYVAFDPADRAQGIPPTGADAVGTWLDTILESGYDVVARHGEACVGHATLVEDGEDAHELAIFVLDTHQQAGIGSQLMAVLLGHARADGAKRVWLTVERWNQAAITLYHDVGFETCDSQSFEMEMSLRL